MAVISALTITVIQPGFFNVIVKIIKFGLAYLFGRIPDTQKNIGPKMTDDWTCRCGHTASEHADNDFGSLDHCLGYNCGCSDSYPWFSDLILSSIRLTEEFWPRAIY